MKPIELTKADFIQKVGNFEADPKDWKYIGDKPCIVDFQAPWCGYWKRHSTYVRSRRFFYVKWTEQKNSCWVLFPNMSLKR